MHLGLIYEESKKKEKKHWEFFFVTKYINSTLGMCEILSKLINNSRSKHLVCVILSLTTYSASLTVTVKLSLKKSNAR